MNYAPIPESSLDISSLPNTPKNAHGCSEIRVSSDCDLYKSVASIRVGINDDIDNEDDIITDVTTADFSESELLSVPVYSNLKPPEPAPDLIVSPEHSVHIKQVRFNPAVSVTSVSPLPLVNAVTELAEMKLEEPQMNVYTDVQESVTTVEAAGSKEESFIKPKLHSTLRLQQQLHALEQACNDKEEACLITAPVPVEIACQALNVEGGRRLFRDLINVDPEEEEVVCHAERQRQKFAHSVLKKSCLSASLSATTTTTQEHMEKLAGKPDALEFYDADSMVVQWLDTSLPGLPDLTPSLCEADMFLMDNVYQQVLHRQSPWLIKN